MLYLGLKDSNDINLSTHRKVDEMYIVMMLAQWVKEPVSTDFRLWQNVVAREGRRGSMNCRSVAGGG